MKNYSRLGVLALVLGVALVLGACGYKTVPTTTTTGGTNANVTFDSEPLAEVWIAGEARGSTPLVIALEPGSHDVVFKRHGFIDIAQNVDVEAGEDITVRGELAVAGNDEIALKRLLAVVGEQHEAFAEPRTHRGAGDAVTLYFPAGDVRREGLGTYRLEVDASYDYDGYIEFRKGNKVIHREKFEPETIVTEKALPTEVLEAARNGAKLSWGLTFDGKRRKKDAKVVKFSVVSRSREKSVSKGLNKMTRRKAYQGSDPLVQEMAQIDFLKNKRLYSEVLVRSLGVLNAWSDTMMPYRNMVDVMQRLKLRDSSLYKFAAEQVSGAGGRRLITGERYVRPNSARKGAKAGGMDMDAPGRKAGQGTGLPPIALAPKSKAAGQSGAKAGGGFSVTPTSRGGNKAAGDAASEDAASAGTEDQNAVSAGSAGVGGAGRQELAAQVETLRDQLREAELKAARADEAENMLHQIHQEIDEASKEIADATEAAAAADEAAAAAEKKHADLVEAGAPQNEIDTAQADADKKQADAAAAHSDMAARQNALNELEEAKPGIERDARRTLKEAGDSGAARAEADLLREQIERAEAQASGVATPGSRQGPGVTGPGSGNPGSRNSGTGTPGTGNAGTGTPGTGNPGTGTPGTGTPGTGTPGTGTPGTQPDAQPQGPEVLDRLFAAARDLVDGADQAVQDATARHQEAMGQMEQADAELQTAEASLKAMLEADPPTATEEQLQQAQEAREMAAEHAARTQMDVERASADVERLQQNLGDAHQEVEALNNKVAPNDPEGAAPPGGAKGGDARRDGKEAAPPAAPPAPGPTRVKGGRERRGGK